MQRLAAQVEEAVAQADILGIFLLARHGIGSSSAADSTVAPRANTSISPVARLALTVPAERAFTTPSIVTTDSTRTLSRMASAGVSLSATIWVMP